MNRIKFAVVTGILGLSLVGLADGITTNLVVYTDVHVPRGTSHYYATKTNLVISNGVITACTNAGVFDLYSGKPESEALALIEQRRSASETNRVERAGLLGEERLRVKMEALQRRRESKGKSDDAANVGKDAQ